MSNFQRLMKVTKDFKITPLQAGERIDYKLHVDFKFDGMVLDMIVPDEVFTSSKMGTRGFDSVLGSIIDRVAMDLAEHKYAYNTEHEDHRKLSDANREVMIDLLGVREYVEGQREGFKEFRRGTNLQTR